MALLIEGAVLAVLVVWLFLRDWRATLVSATARCRCPFLPAFVRCTCSTSASTW